MFPINTQLLTDTGNDFANIIKNNQDTSLSYSSEFWSLKALLYIYKYYKTFPFFSSVYQQEMHYAFTQTLSDKEKIAELNANMAQENHGSATERPEIL